jgi:hypothetical protein
MRGLRGGHKGPPLHSLATAAVVADSVKGEAGVEEGGEVGEVGEGGTECREVRGHETVNVVENALARAVSAFELLFFPPI